MSGLKLLVVCCLLLAVVVCRAESISVDSAATIANKFLSANRASWQVDIRKSPGQPYAFSKGGSSAACYIFKGSGNRGFVVVAADDVARPILGYSFDAKVPETDDLPPAMQDWLEDIEQQIRAAKEAGLKRTTSLSAKADGTEAGNIIANLGTAEWGQGAPYNNDCPKVDGKRCLAGCQITAYAILLRYYRYPSGGTGTTPSYTTEKNKIVVPSRNLDHDYNWGLMPLKYVDGQYNSAAESQVSTLMADLGAAMLADYDVDNTLANIDKGESVIFKYYNYYPGIREYRSAYSVNDWYDKLRNEIDHDRPILYTGIDKYTDGGHMFIIDGYTDKNYFCVNWGWGGSLNGNYALDALQPYDYDYDYSGQAAYFGCVPMPLSSGPNVVEMNGTAYPSLVTALSYAPTNGEVGAIKLLSDIKTNGFDIGSDMNITVDLNGKEVIQYYGIKNFGTFTMADNSSSKTGKVTISNNNAIVNNFSTVGKLTMKSGTYINNATSYSGNDYRRAVWSEAGTNTVIEGGTYSSTRQTLCFNGNGTISGGTFGTTGNIAVVSNYGKGATVTITGGTFTNTASAPSGSDPDYRRAVWTDAGTNTVIHGGTFSSPVQTLCFNGDGTISGGTFRTTENSAVVNNYNQSGALTITGGTFTNTASAPSGSGNDFRRAMWTAAGTNTVIKGGTFSSPHQVLCFNDKATISNGTITNTNSTFGIITASDALVNILGCKLKANNLFHVNGNSAIVCQGGIYSKEVEANYIKEGYKCASNPDSSTQGEYPYAVLPLGGITGDVNKDGNVNSADVQRIYALMARGASSATNPEADVNGDGHVNSADIQRVYSIMARK